MLMGEKVQKNITERSSQGGVIYKCKVRIIVRLVNKKPATWTGLSVKSLYNYLSKIIFLVSTKAPA